ncbi:MAG: response regulator, partial [Deltaproteobacteria bacterium]|nr:response regulator [Deltaproteobacteria bacterium]
QPVAPFQKMLYNKYSNKIVIMFIILILMLGIAALFSRRLASTGEQLSRVTAGLPEKVASNQTIDWPESGVEDIRHLVANFKEMAASLQAQFREVKEINESLESQIEARTQELQASKDKLSSAVEIARLGHWEYDVAKDLFTFNDSFYRIFFTTADQAGGYTMTSAEYTRRFVHSEDAPMVGEEIRKAMETTDPGFSRQFEHRILRADGTTGHISVRYFVVKDAHGKTVKTYGVNQDITERKYAEKEHKNLQAQLSQAQKMESVGRLAGGVAHDFNNQLSIILGYTELAIGDLNKSDSIYSTLQEVLNAGKRSADIVRQLLAFARKQSISPKVIDLNDTIESMLKMLRRLIGEDIDLKWNPDNHLWYVKMDPSQVDQILANLCVNARDAIEGNGKITIETLNVAIDEVYCATHEDFLPGEYVMLGVSDDGSGMDLETLPNIFEPFFTTKGLGKGTGLGLSTVYGIVKQNEGFINAYSEPKKGTTFKIYLPRYKGETKSEVEKQSEEIPKSEGETILVVEDDRTVLQMTKEALEKLGYTVLAMDSPTDTLNMVEEYSDDIHLLMTDVIMPEMDGKQLAEAIKNLRKGIKIIYMSGYTANTIAHHGVLDEGINFIEKPFSIHSLAHKIREALDEVSEKQV